MIPKLPGITVPNIGAPTPKDSGLLEDLMEISPEEIIKNTTAIKIDLPETIRYPAPKPWKTLETIKKEIRKIPIPVTPKKVGIPPTTPGYEKVFEEAYEEPLHEMREYRTKVREVIGLRPYEAPKMPRYTRALRGR